MNWYLKVLQNYATFSGRARRKEYWMFTLWNVLINVVFITLSMVFYVMGVKEGGGLGASFYVGMFLYSLLGLYSLAVLVPSLAVAVRRLHDIGKEGWWLLVGFIPVVGAIWLLVLLATDSQAGENQYGANPKEIEEA